MSSSEHSISQHNLPFRSSTVDVRAVWHWAKGTVHKSVRIWAKGRFISSTKESGVILVLKIMVPFFFFWGGGGGGLCTIISYDTSPKEELFTSTSNGTII